MSEDVPSLKRIAEPRSLKPPSGIRVEKRRARRWGPLLAFLVLGLILTGVGLAS